MKILLLTKPTFWGSIVKNFISENFVDSMVIVGDWGDKLPNEVYNWDVDFLISYLSPWILPENILNKAKIAAINFHPAPPEYPGIGCYNYAIYENTSEYGATCHHMAPKVDSGDIIEVIRFPLYGNETILSLKQKTMVYMAKLFFKIIDLILHNKELPLSKEKWKREAYTRKEFQEFCKINLQLTESELQKKLRATYFPGARDYPTITIGNQDYVLVKSEEFEQYR